jgi:hypothetical protein
MRRLVVVSGFSVFFVVFVFMRVTLTGKCFDANTTAWQRYRYDIHCPIETNEQISELLKNSDNLDDLQLVASWQKLQALEALDRALTEEELSLVANLRYVLRRDQANRKAVR